MMQSRNQIATTMKSKSRFSRRFIATQADTAAVFNQESKKDLKNKVAPQAALFFSNRKSQARISLTATESRVASVANPYTDTARSPVMFLGK